MKSRNFMSVRRRRALTIVMVLAADYIALRAADMKPEDVVALHLDSIGTAEVRAAAKSRIVQGTSHFKILVGGRRRAAR